MPPEILEAKGFHVMILGKYHLIGLIGYRTSLKGLRV